jgi:ubiquinone/menaquinone biosynthesis C-methylase UbiE
VAIADSIQTMMEMEMNQSEPDWGTDEWFSKRFKDEGTTSPSAYFSYNSNGYQKLRHRRLLNYIKKNSNCFSNNPSLVDIGCATGYLSNALGACLNAKEVTAIDFSLDLVTAAKKNYPNIKFVHSKLPFISLPSNSADTVSLVEVLYYVDEELRVKALKDCTRLLKERGIILLTANISGKPYLCLKEINQLIKKAGLKIKNQSNEYYRFPVALEGLLLSFSRIFDCALNDRKDRVNSRAGKIAVIFSNPIGKYISKIGLAIVNSLISARLLMSAFEFVNRLVPIGGPTHVILVLEEDQ